MKYYTPQDVCDAIVRGEITKPSVSHMVAYCKKHGDYKRAKMFKLGLVEYEYMGLISEDDQEEN